MSAQRDELYRLVEELPEEKVPAAVDEMRQHLRLVTERPWPAAWFGAAIANRSDTAARAEDLLADGFGQEA